jgi:hypothetical protein
VSALRHTRERDALFATPSTRTIASVATAAAIAGGLETWRTFARRVPTHAQSGPRASIAPMLGRNSVRSASSTPESRRTLLTGKIVTANHSTPNAGTRSRRRQPATPSITAPPSMTTPATAAGVGARISGMRGGE